jgi:guanylate kinase
LVAKEIIEEPESKMEEVSHDDMDENKTVDNDTSVSVDIDTSTRAPEDNRETANTGFIPTAAVETVGIEKPKKKRSSKKKADVEQVVEDKSNSTSIEDQVNTMIANDDTTGLESIYKQIVKELATKNRSKSTHWGPLKPKK